MLKNKSLKSLLVTAFFTMTCVSVSLPVLAEEDDDLVVTIMCWFICPPDSSDK